MRDARAVRSGLERLRPAAVIHTAYRQDGRRARARPRSRGAAAGWPPPRAAVGRPAGRTSRATSIFDGSEAGALRRRPIRRSPITDYGRAKADAELAVAAAHPAGAAGAHVADLWGRGREPPRAARASRRRAATGSSSGFFEDELRCPVLVDELAAALLELVERAEHGVLQPRRCRGGEPLRFACLVAGCRRGCRPERDPAHVDRGGRARRVRATARSTRAAPRRCCATRLRGAPRAPGRRRRPDAARRPRAPEASELLSMEDWVLWMIAAGALAVGEIFTLSFFLGPIAAPRWSPRAWRSWAARSRCSFWSSRSWLRRRSWSCARSPGATCGPAPSCEPG